MNFKLENSPEKKGGRILKVTAEIKIENRLSRNMENVKPS